jgi:F-type H+-transporting ATPase subunit alpha
MQISAAEISDIIRQQIQDYEKQLEVRETGVVLSAGDGIARVYGLDKVAAGELIALVVAEEDVAPEGHGRDRHQPLA